MGCASSKIDDTDAVALCRSRVAALDAALRRRYDLAEAHLAYLQSLRSVSVSLHRFFHSAAAGDALVNTSAAAPPSPILNLPGGRKIDDDEEDEHLEHHIKSPGSSSPHHLSHSSSGSHIHFDPDSEDEDEISGSEPLHHDPGMFREGLGMNSNFNFNPHNVQMNFMKKQPTPSVSYQQKPAGMESVQIEVTNPPYYPYYMPNQNSNSHFYGDPYGAGGGGGYGMGGYFGGQYSSQPENGGFGGNGTPSTSENRPPPPPPPSASTSTWDFLNPFENIEANYPPPYTPSRASKGSRDSREVREEEGIPDLEDEDYHLGAVNEVHGGQKLADVGGGGGSSSDGGRKSNSMAAEAKEIGAAEAGYRARPSDSQEPDRGVYEVHMVDKEVVREEGRRSEEQGNVGAFNGRRGGFRNVSEVVREIQVQFERASDSGGELGRMLEAGKLPYRHKSSAYQVSSKMLYNIAPSLPSTSKDSDSVADVEDTGLSSGSLSATLQKLYLWEKKLFEEVKVEEKNGVAHERKVKKLQQLDERGVEVQKIDASCSAIRELSTKIRISIQIIDKISVKISKLRDEELWLQLNELIQGFSRMWKGMLECHHSQCQAVDGATGLDAIVSSKNSSDAHLEAILQLEHELINWTTRFSNWIDTQKGYVTALNEWLLKCIVCEPEETADGQAPFSPGRAGAPPIFVICNQWAQSLDRLSEKEVIDSMKVFAAMVFQFWERDKVEMQERMVADKDVERKVKNLQREDMKIQKQIQALEKKTVHYPEEPNSLPLSGNVVYPGDTKTSLQSGLQHIFEAMDRYTSESLKVYEELLSRSEEVVRERSGV